MLSGVIEFFEDLRENIPNRIRINGAMTENILLSGRHVHFYPNHTRSILSAVVLLFHHQIEFIDPVLPGSVLQSVVFKWLTKPDQGNSTLVFDLFAHPLFCFILNSRNRKGNLVGDDKGIRVSGR